MSNQGERAIGVAGRDKRVCVSCVASYSLGVLPPLLDSGGGLVHLALLWLFSAKTR